MAVYGFSRLRIELAEDKEAARRQRARAYVTTAAVVVLVAVPLAWSTAHAIESRSRLAKIQDYVDQVTEGTKWSLVSITPQENDTFHVIVKGEPPLPDVGKIYDRLRAAGLNPDKVSVEFVPTYSFDAEHTTAPQVSAAP